LTPPSNAGQAGFKRLLFERSEFAGAPAWPSRAGQVRAANPSRRVAESLTRIPALRDTGTSLSPSFWVLFT